MSAEWSHNDSIEALAKQLHDGQRVMLSSIVGSLMLRESESVPPLSGGMLKDDLQQEAVANYREIDPSNHFTIMDFHFVLENLAASKAVTIYPEGMVRLGNYPGADPAAITIRRRRMSTIEMLQTEAYWGINPGCLDRPGPRW